MHSKQPRRKVLACGKRYPCKGNVNQKKSVQHENSPPPITFLVVHPYFNSVKTFKFHMFPLHMAKCKHPCVKYLDLFHSGGGDRGAGGWEKRGREVYRRREKRGREAGFPRWREAGEKGKNYATLGNILQSKKCKGTGAKKYRAGTGITGYGKREV